MAALTPVLDLLQQEEYTPACLEAIHSAKGDLLRRRQGEGSPAATASSAASAIARRLWNLLVRTDDGGPHGVVRRKVSAYGREVALLAMRDALRWVSDDESQLCLLQMASRTARAFARIPEGALAAIYIAEGGSVHSAMDTIQSAHNQTIIGDCLASLAGTKLLLASSTAAASSRKAAIQEIIDEALQRVPERKVVEECCRIIDTVVQNSPSSEQALPREEVGFIEDILEGSKAASLQREVAKKLLALYMDPPSREGLARAAPILERFPEALSSGIGVQCRMLTRIDHGASADDILRGAPCSVANIVQVAKLANQMNMAGASLDLLCAYEKSLGSKEGAGEERLLPFAAIKIATTLRTDRQDAADLVRSDIERYSHLWKGSPKGSESASAVEVVLFRRVQRLMQAESWRPAMTFLDLALSLARDGANGAKYKCLKARCLLKCSQFEEASSVAAGLDASDPIVLALKVEIALENRQVSEATSYCRAALGSDSWEEKGATASATQRVRPSPAPEAVEELARVFFEHGLYEMSVEVLIRGLQGNDCRAEAMSAIERIIAISGQLDPPRQVEIVSEYLSKYVDLVKGPQAAPIRGDASADCDLLDSEGAANELNIVWNASVDCYSSSNHAKCVELCVGSLELLRLLSHHTSMERTLLFIGLFLQSLLCLKGAPRPLLDRAAIYIELGEELIEDADMHKLSASLKRPRPSRGKENGGDDLYQAARCSYGKLFQTVRLFLLLQASPSPDATMRLIGDLEEDSAVIEMALRAHLCTSLTPPDARVMGRMLQVLASASVAEGHVERFAILFRGVIIACMMAAGGPGGDGDDALALGRQACEIVHLAPAYPEDEVAWLVVTFFNLSQSPLLFSSTLQADQYAIRDLRAEGPANALSRSADDGGLGRLFCEMSLSMCGRLTALRPLYEDQIRRGYAQLLSRMEL